MAMTVRREAISISNSAGLGGAFCLVLWWSALNFWSLDKWDKIDEGIAIVIVALAVIKFIEPITRRLRQAFDVDPHCEPLIKKRSVQVITFLILAGTSVAHGLIHRLVHENSWGAVGIVLVGLLLPGGITYCWLLGARQTRPRAKVSGSAGGLILSTIMLWAFYALMGGSFPIALPDGTTALDKVPVADAAIKFLINSIPWAITGFAGGLVIDKGWGKRPSFTILLSILCVSLLVDLSFLLTHKAGIIQSMDDLLITIGWGAGLMVHPDADITLTINPPAAATIK
jgi:hypothetical protein